MNRLVARIAGAAVMIGLAAGAAQADAIADRQEAMKEVGKSMKALAAMAKGEADFDAAAVSSNANTIAEKLEAAKDLFPEGSQSGDKETWAKAEIWSDMATFEEIRMIAVERANAVAAVTEQGNLGAALGALGNDGCKGCHEKFRRPKDN